MNYLLNAPSYVSLVRSYDWRNNAKDIDLKLSLNVINQTNTESNFATAGNLCTICFKMPENTPETGHIIFLLPYEFMQDENIKSEELFSIDTEQYSWNFPLLEVKLPCKEIKFKNFSIPTQPINIYFETYYRSNDDEFFKLPETLLLVNSSTKALSLEVRLSSNFNNNLLRYSVIAELGENERFMVDKNCQEKSLLLIGDKQHEIQLNDGVATGTIKLPQDNQPINAKAVNFNFICNNSNTVDPNFISDLPYQIYWGDLHLHSRESDGSSEAYEVAIRARDLQKLDFIAFNEHIENSLCWRTWNKQKWVKLKDLYDNFTINNEFVIIPGFEYHSYCNLWCFSDDYTNYLGDEYNLTESSRLINLAHKNWHKQEAVAQTKIANFASNPDWLVGYHRLEVLASQQGKVPTPVQLLQLAHYKRPPEIGSEEYLLRGDKVAFFGGTDTHIGLPGTGFKGNRTAPSGFTAIYASELSRNGLHNALKARNCYASMGSRTLLDVRLNNHIMGSECQFQLGEKLELSVRAIGIEALKEFDIVQSNLNIKSVNCNGKNFVEYKHYFEKMNEETNYLFVRLTLEDGRKVWSSPIYF